MSRSRNSIAPHRSYSKTFPNGDLAEIPLHLIENILRQFLNVAQSKFHYISSKIFYDTTSKLCLSQNSIASHRTSSKRIPKIVLLKLQLHLIGNIS